MTFAQRLDDADINGVVRVNWKMGGLHFSQTNKEFSPIADKNTFINVSVPQASTHTHVYMNVALAQSASQLAGVEFT